MSGKPNLVKIAEWQRANPDKVRVYKLRWLELHPEQRREAANGYARRLRMAAIKAYGAACACCGESHTEFLAIDHINGGGNEHRRQVKARSGQNLYNWLKTNRYPPGFRVLCHNCNMALGFYGYCPHAPLVEVVNG